MREQDILTLSKKIKKNFNSSKINLKVKPNISEIPNSFCVMIVVGINGQLDKETTEYKILGDININLTKLSWI